MDDCLRRPSPKEKPLTQNSPECSPCDPGYDQMKAGCRNGPIRQGNREFAISQLMLHQELGLHCYS